MKLSFKGDQCPEFIIEMILSKLDENNYQKKEIKRLWAKENSIGGSYSLSKKLNEIISKLNNKESIIEYYNRGNVYEYK